MTSRLALGFVCVLLFHLIPCLCSLDARVSVQQVPHPANQNFCSHASAWLADYRNPHEQAWGRFSRFTMGQYVRISYTGFERYEAVNITISDQKRIHPPHYLFGSAKLGYYNWKVCCFPPGTLVYIRVQDVPTDIGDGSTISCRASVYGLFRISAENSQPSKIEPSFYVERGDTIGDYYHQETTVINYIIPLPREEIGPACTIDNNCYDKSHINPAPLEVHPSTYIVSNPAVIHINQVFFMRWEGFRDSQYVIANLSCPQSRSNIRPAEAVAGYTAYKLTDEFPHPQFGCFINTTSAIKRANGVYVATDKVQAISQTFDIL